jgi:DNA polymerase-3 subunit epsilon
MKLCIFDTETTGLIKWNQVLTRDTVHTFPNIVQLSWVMMDTETLKLKEYDYIISAKNIPEETTAIHGITQGMNKQQGFWFTLIYDILEICLQECDLIIGHNLDFDIQMINVECMRYNIPVNWNKPTYCTMKNTTHICKILKENYGYKWPKLSELHQFLFEESPANLHNALIDVIVCLRCYYKLVYKQDLFELIKTLKKRIPMEK